MARDRGPSAVRITTVAQSRQAEIAGRQLRYVLSMALRTVCFVGAILASVAGIDWLWPILIAAAVLLPYVAVVMANARHTRGDEFELAEQGAGPVPQLGPATTAAHQPGPHRG